jgi:hypothetical protein
MSQTPFRMLRRSNEIMWGQSLMLPHSKRCQLSLSIWSYEAEYELERREAEQEAVWRPRQSQEEQMGICTGCCAWALHHVIAQGGGWFIWQSRRSDDGFGFMCTSCGLQADGLPSNIPGWCGSRWRHRAFYWWKLPETENWGILGKCPNLLGHF